MVTGQEETKTNKPALEKWRAAERGRQMEIRHNLLCRAAELWGRGSAEYQKIADIPLPSVDNFPVPDWYLRGK